MKKALVPGTFDPITNGHLDVITRAAALFDEVVVGVAYSAKKGPLFTVEERAALAEQATSHLPNVTVAPFNALLVDFAAEIKASAVVKGLRDFEYEFQMTAANYQMDKDVETMFIMSPPQYMFLSSSIVREISSFNGDVAGLVPACVEKALKQRFS